MHTMNEAAVTAEYLPLIEDALRRYSPVSFHELTDSVPPMLAYSLDGGGKRVRPVLCLEFCRLCGGKKENALPFAAAVEFIHTYSLIHDDLPCMDNDDERRGKPSSHMKFGEANALLAGDALLTHAFSVIETARSEGLVNAEGCMDAVRDLSENAGINGMIGGQYIDLDTENKSVGVNVLTRMDLYKTSALIKAACLLGCDAAGANGEQRAAAAGFSENLGLAFQIIDDLLDFSREGTSSDVINGKSTYPGVLGEGKAYELAGAYTEKAVRSLGIFGGDADFLRFFAEKLLSRKV